MEQKKRDNVSLFLVLELEVSRVLSVKDRAIIYLGEQLLVRSSSLPESQTARTAPISFCLALLRMGFT